MRRAISHKSGLLMLALVLALPAHNAQAQQPVIDTTSIGYLIQQLGNQMKQLMGQSNQTDAINASATAGAESMKYLFQKHSDGIVAGQVGVATAKDSADSQMGDKHPGFCRRITDAQAMQGAYQARSALAAALKTAALGFTAGLNDDLGANAVMQKMCQAGVIPKSTDCPNPPMGGQYADGRVFGRAAVIAYDSYKWPKVLVVDQKTGRLTISGTPSDEDMPALVAILSCALHQRPTSVSIDPNKVQQASTARLRMQQYMEQGIVADASDGCFEKVADRLIVPSGLGGNMSKISDANALWCEQRKEKMMDQDYANCSGGNGTNFLTIAMAGDCGIQNQKSLMLTADSDHRISNLDRVANESLANCQKARNSQHAADAAWVNNVSSGPGVRYGE